jgi:hypothetical protein
MHRRNFLLLGGVGLRRLYASSSDFWNKKDPADWTGAEKDQLTNKSPWAKEITVSNSPYGSMGRAMGMPYPGYPPGYPGGGPRGSAGQSYKGIIRWESALPVRNALKEPLPEGFENMYVISVGGIPLNAGSRSPGSSQYPSRYPSQYPPPQQQEDSPESDQKLLDRMRGATLLEPKDKRYLQPALVVQQPAGYGNVYFGFAKDIVTLRPEDREVGFTTQFGQIQAKTKFYLKDMLYHGELAV